MSKNIQVTTEFYNTVENLLHELEGISLTQAIQIHVEQLKSEIEDKKQRKINRIIYSTYKTAKPDSEERNEFRNLYHERVQTKEGFRSQKEVTF